MPRSTSVGVPREGETIMPRTGGADYRIAPNGCWIWLRSCDPAGCPRVSRSKSVPHERAHREYYRRARGDIPHRVDIVRTCDERLCVNPDHGRAVTHAERLGEVHQDMSPLTLEDVRTIRADAKAGVKQEMLCDRYGIASASMSKIVQGKTWKDPTYQPGVERECAYGDCAKKFVTNTSNKRYCCAAHRDKQNNRVANGYYARQAAKKSARNARRVERAGLRNVTSLDAPLGATTATLTDFVAANDATSDPETQLEAAGVREITAELSVDDVAHLDEVELRRLRRQLAAAGLTPSVQRRSRAA